MVGGGYGDDGYGDYSDSYMVMMVGDDGGYGNGSCMVMMTGGDGGYGDGGYGWG